MGNELLSEYFSTLWSHPKKALFIRQIFLDWQAWSPIQSVGDTGIMYIFTQINSLWKLIRAKQHQKSAFHKVIQCHRWGDGRTGSGVLGLSAFMRKVWDTVKPSSKLILFHIPLPPLSYYNSEKRILCPSQVFSSRELQLPAAALSLWSLALKSKECLFCLIKFCLLQILEKFYPSLPSSDSSEGLL